ncbi:histidine phosphatase family protein [Janthinobacterium sp. 17J80-10]|uniref:histidine phosphatase family protein n=1 Tax=Janthinobacterium sp. 17J80-10 TaxID=2497863 RepID=UPI00100591F1|nr:histidine phosphatase family protein [Janthinobacterium sp. 17J80-10]QAU35755.1 histidine phosphatase family protein [Janthinobacterium sp. 17J80-10]
MTEILLIRHGETDWNTERRLQGHLDIALNAEGVRQAQALGHALRGETLDAIFSSDLGRARQTAQAIAAGRALEVQIEPGLRERCYGAFEGLRHADIEERYPREYAAWRGRELDAVLPAGAQVAETLREFAARAVGAVVGLAVAHQLRRIAVVSHGGVLECICREARGLGWSAPRDFDIRNASINRLHWNGNTLRVLAWGDVAHLQQDALDEVDRG